MEKVKCSFYTFGQPIETNSIVAERVKPLNKSLNYSKWSQSPDLKHIHIPLSIEASVYGFGQSLGGYNKRGQSIVSYCTDDSSHTEGKKSLYGAHNFFIIAQGQSKTGVFVDASCRIQYDVGLTRRDLLTIELAEPDYRLLILESDSYDLLVREWFQWIGKSYLPPFWGLGYIQSRWGYKTQADIQAVIDQFEVHQIPLDGVCLDIDYMERFKDFTIDSERFPDFKGLSRSAAEKGVHLVPIIDAGIKIESGYDVYEEGVKGDFFCTNEQGEPFIGAVWPGLVHFPDFLNPEVRHWFGNYYGRLMDLGVDGFWNDMNEPAIFFTPERLAEVKALYAAADPEALDVMPYFELMDAARTLINHDSYQSAFYHKINGDRVVHHKVHNQFGYRMTQSAYEGFRRYSEDRKLIFSRASLIGAHRYGGLWMGDNASWWQHLKLNMSMLVSMNLCGFLYIGADTGGFSHDAEPELIIRWHQLSMFTPLFRNHSAFDTTDQEPYVFETWTLSSLKASINWRYRLLFWQFSELLKATVKGRVIFKPMEWVFEVTQAVEDQVIYGDSILLAPVLDRNQSSRLVELPEHMCMVRMKADGSYEAAPVTAGVHRIAFPLDEQVIFLLRNQFLVINDPIQHTVELNPETLTCIAYIEDKGTLELMWTGGTYGYESGHSETLTVVVEKQGNDYKFLQSGGIAGVKVINWQIYDGGGQVFEKRMEVSL